MQVKRWCKNGFCFCKIYDAQNTLLRNLKWEADTGFNRKYWGMEEKGYRFPGSPKPKPNSPEPGGNQVLPGTYKVVISNGKDADSSFVTIKADPRKENNNAVLIAQRALQSRLRTSSDKLTLGLDQLTDAEEIAKKYEAQLKDVEGKEADSVRKQSKKMQDAIKDVRDFVSGKKIERQGYGQLPVETVMTALQEAMQYIRSKNVAPGKQEETLVVKAETKIAEAISKINNFFSDKWKGYQAW
ncbi:MAG: hypothetical protein IPP48_13860 [Chitinophagaceae bacterium]|nr:hypothetical protein [Chitinophagaceae bacterium]